MGTLEGLLLRTTRPAVLLIITVLFCAGTGLSGYAAYTAHLDSSNSIKQLERMAAAVEQDMHLFHHLRSAFGYGGYIHHFKNYILTGDSSARQAVDENYHHLMHAVAEARAHMALSEAQQALDQIAATIQAYADHLPLIEQGWAQGLSSREINAAIRIDDSAAIAALGRLDNLMMSTMSGIDQPFFTAAANSERLYIYSATATFIVALLVIASLLLLYQLNRMLLRSRQQGEALERSNLRYHNILATAADGIVIASERGIIEDANQAAERMFGYEQGELIGQSINVLMNEQNAAQHDSYIAQYRTTGKSHIIGNTQRQMLYGQRKDGTPFPVEIHLSMADTPNGRVFTGVISDVTEQREYENTLRRSDAGMRAAQRIAQIGSWEWDVASGSLYWSDEIYRIFGQEPGAFQPSYDAFYSMVHPDDREKVLASEARAKQGKRHDVEHRIIRADGSVRWVHELAEMTLAPDGSPVRMQGTVQDITGRKVAEEELNRFKSTLDLTADCVFMFHPDSLRFFYVNQGAIQQVGYSEDELLQMTPFDIKPEYDESQFRALIESLLQGTSRQLTFESIHRHKSGQLIPVEIMLQYVAPEGEPPRFVAIVRDIKARKQEEELKRRQTDNLRVLNDISSYRGNSLEQRIGYALSQAAKHLGMEVGIVSHIEGTSYTVEHCITTQDIPLSSGQVFELGNTYCDLTVKQNGVVAIEHMLESPYAGHPCYREFPLEAYIGIPFSVSDAFYGTVNFSSRSAYPRRIIDSDHEFMRLLAVWVGAAIEREWTIRRLRTSEDRLQSSQTFANIGTWDWNIQSGDLYWSDRIAPLFGYAKGELETTYDNFLLAVHPDDRKQVIDAVTACVEGKAAYDIEHRVVWPDGTVHWMLERGDVVRAEDGTPLNMLGVVQDITARKQAEGRLRESEALLRDAQRIGRIGNWTWNITTGEMAWSDEIYHIYGLEPGSVNPTYELYLSLVHPDDMEAVNHTEHGVISEGRKRSIDHRIILSSGELRWVHMEIEPFADESGRVQRLVGTTQDITQRKRNEDELLAAKEEAERANHTKSDFLSSMSHELRTPMNAILGFAQLLESESLSEEQQDYNKEILRAGRHLLELINEVLDLAKVESGRIDLSLEAVDCNELIQECLTLITPLTETNSITVRYTPAGSAMGVRADRTRLKQVLLNLLSNAIKYNKAHGSVEIKGERIDSGRMRLSIRDSGPGISPEDQNKLFEAFNRLHAENSNIEGTGIGLVISKRLVEMMGGAIGFDSQPGVGSTFWIDLPEEGMHQASAGIEDEALRPLQADYNATILYIEDNPANLKLVSMLLGKRPNLRLLTAHLPEIGLELAHKEQANLILLDINMPGMDGYQVLERLLADPTTRNIPVVAITANAMPKDIARGKEAGFRDYLTKPIDVPMFYATLDRWLGHETVAVPPATN